MSHRGYAIDRPGSDDEEDIVVSAARSQAPTESDRDLLRADEQIVRSLEQKSQSRIPSGRSFLPKRKLKFQEYIPLESTKHGNGGSHGDVSGDESQDESDYDIEIDLETQPVRRRVRHHNRTNQSLIILTMVVLGVLFLMLVGSERASDHHHQPTSKVHQFNPISKTPVRNGTHWFYPTTIVVSLDGFHPHYVSPDLTPNLHALMTNYSAAPYMEPSFPSQTFPNHWTMVTGRYPGNHGIVGNTFWDPKLRVDFQGSKPNLSDAELQHMYGGEPIWHTAYYQGVKTAIHMWPGSEVPWPGLDPEDLDQESKSTIWEVDPFNKEEKLDNKVNRLFEWLDVDSQDDRPELVLLYVPEVDTYGHKYGISGAELRSAIQNVDNMVGKIRTQLEARNLGDIANLLVVSDHGMAPTSNERLIYLDDLIQDMSVIKSRKGWPLVALRMKNSSDIDVVYESLKTKQQNAHWQVFRKQDMPLEWNFGGVDADYDYRIAPLYIVPEVGWSITTHAEMEANGGDYQPHGVHGYNNTEVLMRSLFVGQGPYFGKHGGGNRHLFRPFPNVDLYNILCDTLSMKPAQTDGAPVQRALQKLGDWHDTQSYPGVAFDTEILKVNSTYDLVFSSVSGNMGHESWLENAEDAVHDAYEDVHDWISDKFGGHKENSNDG